jgi:hypothetical protein
MNQYNLWISQLESFRPALVALLGLPTSKQGVLSPSSFLWAAMKNLYAV